MTESRDTHVLKTILGGNRGGLHSILECVGHEECEWPDVWAWDSQESAAKYHELEDVVLDSREIRITSAGEYGVEDWHFVNPNTPETGLE